MKNSDIEKRLNILQDEDPTNPEIYELLVKLTGNLIMSQKWNMSPADFDCVTHDVATDMFLKVSQGYYIRVWRAFCYRLIKYCYVPKQRKISNHQVFDIKSDPLAREAIINSFISSGNSFNKDATIVETRSMLSNMHDIIEEVLNGSKYANLSKERLALDMSISLSLIHKKPVYFHLSEDLKLVLNMYITKVKEILMDSLRITNSNADIAFNSLYTNELFIQVEEDL